MPQDDQPPHISSDQFERLSDALADLGDDKLSQVADVEHKTKLMKPDELWKLYAVGHYEKAIRHPVTRELHRDDASKILGMLNQITDEGLADEWLGMRQHLTGRCTTMASTLARMIQILVQRRGLGSLVAERERKALAN